MIGDTTIHTDRTTQLVQDLLTDSPGTQTVARRVLGRDVDAREFSVTASWVAEYPSTAGPRHGGIAGRAFTRHSTTLIASSELILIFTSDRLLGYAPYSEATLIAYFDGANLDQITQVDPDTGDVTWEPRQ